MMRVLLVPVLLLVPAAMAAVDDTWQRQDRDVQLERTASGATVTSVGEDDRIDIRFDAPAGRLEYTFNGPDGVLRIEQRVIALVEWQDMDGDGRYSLGDRTVHRTRLDGAPHAITSQETGNGVVVAAQYTIIGQAPDSDPLVEPQVPTGHFTMTFSVLERTRTADGSATTPTEVPVVLSVDAFPFREEATELAFEVQIVSATTLARAVSGQPLSTAIGNHTVFYAWQPDATLDGAPVASRVTEFVRSPSDSLGAAVYYAFGRGDAAQETRVGTVRSAGIETLPRLLQGDPFLFASAAVVMAALVGVPAALRMRRR